MKKMSDLLALALVFLLGTLPTITVLIWIERNMALPWVGTWIGWPWIFLDGGIVTTLVFDVVLVAAFAVASFKLLSGKPRVFERVGAGLLCILVMGAWQPTGITLFQLIPSAEISSAISMVLYWSILAFAFFRPHVIAGCCRLPTLIVAAGVVTPFLSLDRLLLSVVLGALACLGKLVAPAGIEPARAVRPEGF